MRKVGRLTALQDLTSLRELKTRPQSITAQCGVAQVRKRAPWSYRLGCFRLQVRKTSLKSGLSNKEQSSQSNKSSGGKVW